MNFKILINEKEIGIFGHDDIEHFHFAVTGEPSEMGLHVSGIIRNGSDSEFYDWLKLEIGQNPKIEIIPTETKNTVIPRKTYLLNNLDAISRICDFCRKDETEVEKILYIDENQPAICSECADRCNQILNKKV